MQFHFFQPPSRGERQDSLFVAKVLGDFCKSLGDLGILAVQLRKS